MAQEGQQDGGPSRLKARLLAEAAAIANAKDAYVFGNSSVEGETVAPLAETSVRCRPVVTTGAKESRPAATASRARGRSPRFNIAPTMLSRNPRAGARGRGRARGKRRRPDRKSVV